MQDCQMPLTLIQALTYSPEISKKCEYFLNAAVHPTSVTLLTYLGYFFLTCALEAPFYFRVSRGESLKKRLIQLVSANLATHPIVFFLLPWLFSLSQSPYKSYLLTAESFAPLVEGMLLWLVWKVPARVAFPVMILANLFSWTVGAWIL